MKYTLLFTLLLILSSAQSDIFNEILVKNDTIQNKKVIINNDSLINITKENNALQLIESLKTIDLSFLDLYDVEDRGFGIRFNNRQLHDEFLVFTYVYDPIQKINCLVGKDYFCKRFGINKFYNAKDLQINIEKIGDTCLIFGMNEFGYNITYDKLLKSEFDKEYIGNIIKPFEWLEKAKESIHKLNAKMIYVTEGETRYSFTMKDGSQIFY
jgi:hypothetical protein